MLRILQYPLHNSLKASKSHFGQNPNFLMAVYKVLHDLTSCSSSKFESFLSLYQLALVLCWLLEWLLFLFRECFCCSLCLYPSFQAYSDLCSRNQSFVFIGILIQCLLKDSILIGASEIKPLTFQKLSLVSVSSFPLNDLNVLNYLLICLYFLGELYLSLWIVSILRTMTRFSSGGPLSQVPSASKKSSINVHWGRRDLITLCQPWGQIL